jgi:hypothetical protein
MDIIKIDFRSYNSVENFQRLITDHNLPFDAEILFEMKKSIDFLYVDVNNGYMPFASQDKKTKEIAFYTHFIEHLEEINPLKFKKKKKKRSHKKYELDYILDKINISGINSLSPGERIFLESQSQ